MKTGGDAFPFSRFNEKGEIDWGSVEQGMTLRDYFAGQALIALVGSPHLSPDNGKSRGDTVARNAYLYADAMLAEREKGEGR